MSDLRTNYTDDQLDASVNVNRTFSIIDNETGTVIYPNVSLEETTVFTRQGDSHTASITNQQNAKINEISNNLTETNEAVNELSQQVTEKYSYKYPSGIIPIFWGSTDAFGTVSSSGSWSFNNATSNDWKAFNHSYRFSIEANGVGWKSASNVLTTNGYLQILFNDVRDIKYIDLVMSSNGNSVAWKGKVQYTTDNGSTWHDVEGWNFTTKINSGGNPYDYQLVTTSAVKNVNGLKLVFTDGPQYLLNVNVYGLAVHDFQAY